MIEYFDYYRESYLGTTTSTDVCQVCSRPVKTMYTCYRLRQGEKKGSKPHGEIRGHRDCLDFTSAEDVFETIRRRENGEITEEEKADILAKFVEWEDELCTISDRCREVERAYEEYQESLRSFEKERLEYNDMIRELACYGVDVSEHNSYQAFREDGDD